MGDALVLSQYSLRRNHLTNLAGVLKHCREGETNCWFSIFRGVFFSDRIPKQRRMSMSTCEAEISLMLQFLLT